MCPSRVTLALLLGSLFWTSPPWSQTAQSSLTVADTKQPPQLDVPYVPTSAAIVAAMLRLANVTATDTLYDLGCGDGRIVIAAARQFGARAVGVDLNPNRIAEARLNAERAGVLDRVQFLEQDLFATDLRTATVVTLYLLPSVNLRLRPILLRDLKPGTRVVSHAFTMEDWRPDRTVEADGATVHLWTIPASVAGTWTWTSPSTTHTEPYRLELTQQFQHVQGALHANGRVIPLTGVELQGNQFRFTAPSPESSPEVLLTFIGYVNGDEITGKILSPGAPPEDQRSWTARRTAVTLMTRSRP